MNTEITLLLPEEGEAIETKKTGRNFNEVSLLLLLFLFLLCKNKHIENIQKLIVIANLFLSIPHASCENSNPEVLTDLKAAHHQLCAKTATSLKVAHYDCSLVDSNKM